MIKLGVFYSLDDSLKKDIESFKLYFSSKCKTSRYLNHLPHSTIYVFNRELNKIDDVLLKFDDFQKSFHQFYTNIYKWKVFTKDIITGLNTLCLEIELSRELKALQMEVVERLSEYHLKNENSNLEGDFKMLNDKYGYPFIGNQWIPHITIGSMDINPEKLLGYSRKLLDLPKEITINNLGLYEIEEDSHKLIKKIKF